MSYRRKKLFLQKIRKLINNTCVTLSEAKCLRKQTLKQVQGDFLVVIPNLFRNLHSERYRRVQGLFVGFTILILILSLISPCYAKSLWNGNKNRNVVALTFDDGPKVEYCQPILDCLDRYGAKATFFIVGNEAEKQPDIVMRMFDSGHVVGNHTYSHVPASQLSKRRFLSDVERCNDVIENITGEKPKYFRPPGGKIRESLSGALKKLKIKSVFWTINAGDYTDVTPGYEVPEDVEAMAKILAKNIVDKVKPGSIILLHSSSEQTVKALPWIIEGLRKKGYGLVTVKDISEEII